MSVKKYFLRLTVSGRQISTVLVGLHYEVKHGHYMNDELILELVMTLDGETFTADSTTDGID